MANTNIHDTHLEAPEILRGATSSKATSNKLQATSCKLQAASFKRQAGRRPAPGRGWGSGALPNRGWEISHPHPNRGWGIYLPLPQPPAKYIRFYGKCQEHYCRTYTATCDNLRIAFIKDLGYNGIY